MKLRLAILASVFLCFLPTKSVLAKGQEVGGGDLYSIMFVKMGRLLLSELQTNKSCSIGKRLSILEFKNDLDQIQIETGDRPDSSPYKRIDQEKNHYVLDRMDWMFRPMEDKIRIVLSAYSKRDLGDLSSEEIRSCKKSKLWEKIAIEGIYEKEIPEVDLRADARNVSNQLIALLRNQGHGDLISDAQLGRLEECAKRAEFSVSNIPIHFKGNTIKDGVYDGSHHAASIRLDEATWIALNQGQKMELLFHEYLGLMGIDDLKYRFSSRIFFLADEKFYRS